MARTHKKVSYSLTGKLEDVTPDMAASGIESAFRILEGRWKMVIVFHLFARGILRFSELEKAIPAASAKMLTQQLRELERDGVVSRNIGGADRAGGSDVAVIDGAEALHQVGADAARRAGDDDHLRFGTRRLDHSKTPAWRSPDADVVRAPAPQRRSTSH